MAPRIAIVGAGFGGLCLAIRLRRAGIGSFTVFEKAAGLGGTWRDNTYPGAGCDIPSHLYSYSFERYGSWTRRYPEQSEILAYLEHCADKYDVRRNIRFNTEVVRASFDGARWHLGTAGGDSETFDAVVMAVGQLNRPRLPDIPGMSGFRGTSFHSARWNHDHDLTGRRVAVIGSGSSAAQLIPRVAERAGHLTVFQRTPNWVIPKPDAAFGPAARLALRLVPGLQRAYRGWLFRYVENTLYPALAGGWSAAVLERRARAHLRAQVADPELRAKLTPGYPPGCKRVVIDSAFYPALTRPDVDVVTERIVRIVPGGVETTGGTHEADTIVYATGFRTTEFLAPIEVTGRDGRALAGQWNVGAHAYLGISVPHFPNLFLLYGPNTNLGHNSIVFMIECQVRHIMACLRALPRHGPLEVRPEAMAAWTRQLDRAMVRMVWVNGCQSWYKTPEGRVTNNWPGPAALYRRLTARPPLPAYRRA
ncbi:cation diffusion facilitator CzcD-associated flavoprotein CzcO [Nonomuraea muscovyensis]|uniref:Cation diffusion facilitator CzcD-associated flavoprotein CzcO n=1 Tax=Nonomuraea muscovyensis TaxID=1124761 RepID=A0A7X0C6U7_9ACTN|nr:NAD(P)/FAD-dependent oxidoreductase [Nonomuraea muscovyensis]MBB6349357.1 cation diffusion facilitator CzcD-associated flavoprotein CzcO [Nonomuraea muscovyensis]